MLTDAHCHPADLRSRYPQGEEERQRLGAACAASAWKREDFSYHESLARSKAVPVALCFGVHPQLPAEEARQRLGEGETSEASLAFLYTLAEEGRLDAVGEAGFDLYDPRFRSTEARQDELFAAQVEIALERALPLVLHVRRGMHKIFAHSRSLKRLPAVVFHSYPGTLHEAQDLLKRGVNAFFSFGTPLLLNHQAAMTSWARLPLERLLLETDAPYQPLRGRPFSSWGDLPCILRAAAALRGEGERAGSQEAELEAACEENFRRVYGKER